MDAVFQVLEKLLARTNESKISWKTTVNESMYVAALGNTSVAITKNRTNPVTFGFPSSDLYSFQIFDEAGIEIESVSSRQAKNTEMFQDLYEKARRFARGTETKLEALLAQLDEV